MEFVAAQAQFTNELARKHPEAVAFIREHFPTKMIVDEEGKRVEVQRDPAATWKSFFQQQYEARALEIKLQVCEDAGIPTGPPMHDGLAVCKVKADGSAVDPEALAREMSEEITAQFGFEVVVEHEVMKPPKIRDNARFERSHFETNIYKRDKAEFDRSLVEYRRWLQRYFVCMTGMEQDIVVELTYEPGTDYIENSVIRTSQTPSW